VENCLVKLSDFGLSKKLEGTCAVTYCGTRGYVAPEVLSCHDVDRYTIKCDIWSLGVVLHQWYVLVSPCAPR
jgi:serine/threonine protein kinase